MNKLFTKIGTAMVGIAMAIGVGVAVGRDSFERVDAIDQYGLLTTTDGLVAGDCVVVASGKSGSTNFLSTNQKTNNRGQVTLTVTNSKVSIPTGDNTDGDANYDVQVLTLGKSGDYWTFSPSSGNYLYAASSNKLKTQTTIDDAAKWTIEIDSEGDNPTYAATITSQTSAASKIMRHNSSSSLFSCYAAGSQNPVYLFKVLPTGDIKPLTISVKYNETTIATNESSGSYNFAGEIDNTEVDFDVSATYQAGAGYVDGSAFSWNSSNEDVATVSSTGVATIRSKGTTTITVRTTDATTAKSFENISAQFVLDSTGGSYPSGSFNNPYTVAQALSIISGLPSGGYSDTAVYTVGIVSRETSYNSSSYISDDGTTTTELYAFNGKYLDNVSFTAETKLLVGDKAVFYGKLQNYNGNTPEIAKDYYLTKVVRGYKSLLSWIDNDNYLDMNGYDVDGTIGSTAGTGKCTTQYWVAKAALAEIEEAHEGAVDAFENCTDSAFTSALARYQEWARIVGDDSPFDMSKTSPSSAVRVDDNNNSSAAFIIAISAIIGTFTIGSLFLIRRKKEEK